MNGWRLRLGLGLVFLATDKAFDSVADGMPYAPVFWLLYYGGAATVDLFRYRIVCYFLSSKLQRDIEALCIASAAVNALGWAIRALADAPPDFYNALMAGLNYAIALKLLLGDGNVLDFIKYRNRFFMVLRDLSGYKKHAPTEEKR